MQVRKTQRIHTYVLEECLTPILATFKTFMAQCIHDFKTIREECSAKKGYQNEDMPAFNPAVPP